MKDVIVFFGKKNLIVFTVLALLAGLVVVGSNFYPLLARRIIEGVEQYRVLDIRLVAIYAGLMLSVYVTQYLGGLALNKWWRNLYYKFRALIVGGFFSLNDREKKENGVG